jgi:hypothetical protein
MVTINSGLFRQISLSVHPALFYAESGTARTVHKRHPTFDFQENLAAGAMPYPTSGKRCYCSAPFVSAQGQWCPDNERKT